LLETEPRKSLTQFLVVFYEKGKKSRTSNENILSANLISVGESDTTPEITFLGSI